MWRRLAPWSHGRSPMRPTHLVARTNCSRRPCNQRPTAGHAIGVTRRLRRPCRRAREATMVGPVNVLTQNRRVSRHTIVRPVRLPLPADRLARVRLVFLVFSECSALLLALYLGLGA